MLKITHATGPNQILERVHFLPTKFSNDIEALPDQTVIVRIPINHSKTNTKEIVVKLIRQRNDT